MARPGLWPCGVSAARVGRFSSVNDRSSGDICHTVRSPSDLFLSLLLIVLFFFFWRGEILKAEVFTWS